MWKLDYDDALVLHIPKEDVNSFQSGSFYKLSLRRYVSEIIDDKVKFKSSLTYLDYNKIISLCQKECSKKAYTLIVGDSLREYINARELHIERRYRLGSELKEHDEKLQERFNSYRETVDSQMARPLRDRQAWDSFFMCAMQKSSNFSVPGSGKTASVLGMYAYLKHKEMVKRIVVVCPKNAFGSWMDEFEACFGDKEPLSVLNIHSPLYKNTHQRRAAIEYDSGKCNLILVNYEAVGGVLESLEEIMGTSTLLVFDEVHKVKRIDGEYAKNALRLAKNACYAVALTGTPIPNSYTDIYNLLHILYPDEYEEFFGFTPAELKNPTDSDKNEINDKINPFFCRTTKDQLGVPSANEDLVYTFRATEEENRLLQILKMKYRKNKLALLIRVLQLESNPKLLLQSLSLSDFSYLLDDSVEVDEIDFADYSKEVEALIAKADNATKFTRCVDTAMSLVAESKTVIIWCMFVDSIRRISEELESKGVKCRCVYGEIPLDERLSIISDFKSGNIQVLLTNPHTLAESVSLHSVCHDAIYYEYSYNLVHLLQSKDRIHRLGLPEGQYTQYHFMQLEYDTEEGEWSLDKAIYDRLKLKEQIMLDAIDNHILEAMPTTDEDLAIIFEKLT